MKNRAIIDRKDVYRLRGREDQLVIITKITDVVDDPRRFLGRYKVSLVAFTLENINFKVIVDIHSPKGLHLHIGEEEAQVIGIDNLEMLFTFFDEEVIKHFGEYY